MTRDVVTSSMIARGQADVVTAVKAAETVMWAVCIRDTRTPALMLDIRTLFFLPECEVRANCIIGFVIAFLRWRYVGHMMRNWSFI